VQEKEVMMDRTRYIGILTLCIIILGILTAGCTNSPLSETGIRSGNNSQAGAGNSSSPAKETWTTLQLTDVVTGKQFSIQDLVLEGKPVVIHTFAVWCSTCAVQLTESTKLQKDNPGKYTVLSMDIDPREDAQAIRNHASKNGYEGLFIAAPPEISRGLIDAYGQRAVLKLPVTIIICNNKATYIGDGAFREATLKEILAKTCP
jgi:hypothetical protein